MKKNRRLFLSMAGTALLAAGCGGSSGSGNGGSDPGIGGTLLPAYAFSITSPEGAGAPFSLTRVAPQLQADSWSLDAGSGSISGLIERTSRDVSFSDSTSFSVAWTQGGPQPAAFSVVATTGGSLFPGSPLPSDGSLAVTWGSESIVVTLGTTVLLQLNDEAPVAVSLSNLLALDADGAGPDWQRVGARAARALTEMLQLARSSMDFLERINAGDFASGMQARSCDAFPGSPPAGFQAQGESVVTELGPGTWESTGTDCLFLGTQNVLANANLLYRNLQVSNGPSGTIVSVAFAPTPGVPGGLLFTDARLSAVAESSPGSLQWVFTGTELRRDGGFAISFSQP
ncbi:MAG: hypothetical protein JJT85_02900 [Chromatiales bacterium]|nr:hypothetical protein [Chromatiales bacterium]